MDRDEERLRELCDLREIEQVILRLARATDRRDSAAIRACYHPDAVDDHGAFRGSAADFAEWVPKTLAIFSATQHFLSPPRIELAGEVARSETTCTAHHLFPPEDPGGARDSIMGLRYVDRFERRDGAWRIARRTCIWDYSYIVPAGDRWPFGPDYQLGRPGPDDPSNAI